MKENECKVLKTLGQILTDREYKKLQWVHPDCEEEANENMNTNMEEQKFPSHLFLVAVSSESKLAVFWCRNDEKLGVKQEREFWPWCHEENVTNVIVITKSITPSASKGIRESRLRTDIFRPNELYRNITLHEAFPAMRRLEPQEKLNLLSKILRTTIDRLPPLSITDASCKYYGWNPGDIIAIARNWGGKQHPSVYYRHIVPVEHLP